MLNPKIVKFLSEKIGLEESTIKKDIYLLHKDYPTSTINAVAQIYARSKSISVFKMLSREDKDTIPNTKVKEQIVKIVNKKDNANEKQTKLIKYETDDYFKKGHIKEVNKAYRKGCYTSVHILARKIIENLIREILSSKYPSTKKENKELYFDVNKNRFKDFSVILRVLYDKRNDFDPDKILMIKSLYQKAKKFKDDSNDATHSWYHLFENKSEIDDLNIQSIIELIKKLEAKYE